MTGRRITFILLSLGFLFGSPGVASADVMSASGYTYISNSDCAWTQPTLRNDWARPHLDTVATMDWWGNGRACGALAQAGKNALAVRQDLLVWNPQTGGNEWCAPGPWQQNNWGPSHEVWTSFGWGSSPCWWVSDWYFAIGRSGTWNGGWHGLNNGIPTGYVWAG
jgi:hypothetical protein